MATRVKGHMRRTSRGATRVRPHKRKESFKEDSVKKDTIKSLAKKMYGRSMAKLDSDERARVVWAYMYPGTFKKESFKERRN